MGNILSLDRNGFKNTDNFNDIDKLAYQYDNGNKLLKVTDTGSNEYGFKGRYTGTDNHYNYDTNGNMTTDLNKGISSITYNYMNLPTQVSIANSQDNGTISYVYDATGGKQKKIVSNTNTNTASIVTEYAGKYVYKNGALQFFNTPEGYVEPNENRGTVNLGIRGTSTIQAVGAITNTSFFNYVFQYKDHLGNIRLSYTDRDRDGKIDLVTDGTNRRQDIDGDGDYANEITEEKNYYPFGLTHQGYNTRKTGTPHNYGFGGKEENDEFGLEWLDFGARNYDAALGKWMNLDPDAHNYYEWSPYNYVGANPLIRTDPDGKNWLDKVVGAAVGAVTNIVPGSTALRNVYTPTDSGDYNTMLRGTDIVASGIGAIAMTVGTAGAAGGGAVAATAGAVSLSGVAAPVSVPVAGAALAVAEAGVVTAAAGAVVSANAAANANAGYNYGEDTSSSSSKNSSNSRPRSTKHTDNRHVDKKKYPNKSKYKKPAQRKKLEDRTMKTDGVKQRDGRVRYDKDYGREIGTNGETSHRVIVDPKKKKIVTSFPQKKN